MFKRFSTNNMVTLFLVDVLLVQIALDLGMRLRFVLPFGQLIKADWIGVYGGYAPTGFFHLGIGALWAAALMLGSAYSSRKVVFWYDEFQRVFLAHTLAALALAGLLYLGRIELLRLTYLYFYLVCLASLLGYRALLRVYYRMRRRNSHELTRVLVVGAGKVGGGLVETLQSQHATTLDLVGFLDDDATKVGGTIHELPVLGKVDNATRIVEKYEIDEVIIALPLHAHARLANLVAELHQLPIRLHVVPDYFDLAFHGATIESLGGIPLIGLRDPAIDGFHRFGKRLMDIVLSMLVLLIFSPIMLLIALAIKLEDRGPIFYRPLRVGENGKLFEMLKFRSMVPNAEKLQTKLNQVDDRGKILHKHARDPRVTHIGRWIRRTSLDELPQLINVLRGEMSLVGPRPEQPWLVDKYEPWQRKRFAVPQGITGWWQINGRSDNPMHLHTEQDIYYIQHYSWWLDIQILWRTIAVVLRGRGAY
ncbi:MAG: sugar transferase [Litorilinea sp.]